MTNQECSLLGFLKSFFTPPVGRVTLESALEFHLKMLSKGCHFSNIHIIPLFFR